MPKQRTMYVCQNCGFESVRWVGQCPNCSSWNSLVESIAAVKSGKSVSKSLRASNVKPFRLKELSTESGKRRSSGILEFDRVLGGGFVPGQVVLLAGEPGIGKSTILLQLADKLNGEILYFSGEESPRQIKLRADRLKIGGENLLLASEVDVDSIRNFVEGRVVNVKGGTGENEVKLVIVDSIQAVSTSDLEGTAGSVGQVRESAFRLSSLAKQHGIPMVIVGQVTKEGSIAGPKVLEHLVDTVLYIEGDEQHLFRLLKTTKNRFGPVSEVGIFRMGEYGLEEVANPSDIFLEERLRNAPGSCVTAVMEGYRPLLYEVQALTASTIFGYPKRTATGFSVNRLSVLVAVLEKRCGLRLSNHDVYLNVAGGMKISEYSSDLAVCLAIASSLSNTSLDGKLAAFGEVGLSGEVRRVSFQEERVKEAKKMGYTKIVSPLEVKSVSEAISLAVKAYSGKKG